MKKKIFVKGPALSQTGYGEQTRFALRALVSKPELFDVYLHPLHWGQSSWLMPMDNDREWIDDLVKKTAVYERQQPSYDVSLQVTIPNEWEKIAPINIGYTAGIETTKVAPGWIEKAGLMDKIIVTSHHSKNNFVNTVYNAVNQATGEQIKFRCHTPIEVVSYPVRHYEPRAVDINLKHDFNFLTVAQWGHRKNLENTVRWFVEEFYEDNVGLVVKTFLAKTSLVDREATYARIASLLADKHDAKCKVYLIHGHMSAEEMTALYRNPQIKGLISLTHGEGFGLPLFEAAYNGLPVIAPDWSGQSDFLYAPVITKSKGKKKTKIKPCFARVDYELSQVPPEAVWEGVLQADSMWCYAKERSYKDQLRAVYKNYDRFSGMAKKLQKHVLKEFDTKKQLDAFANSILSIVRPTEEEQQWGSILDQVVSYD